MSGSASDIYVIDVDEKPLLMMSNSDIEMFKKCRRKWTLASFNRRNLVPKTPNLKFWLGTGGHFALERFHGYGEDPIAAFSGWATGEVEKLGGAIQAPPEFWAEVDKLVRMGKDVLAHYVQHIENNSEYDFEYIATEYEFAVPIPNLYAVISRNGVYNKWVVREWGPDPYSAASFVSLYVDKVLVRELEPGVFAVPILYVGRLDGLVKYKDKVWVIDHKFMAQLVNPRVLQLDTQTARYVWAANIAIKNGWWPEVSADTPVGGALYNVVRKKAPKVPAITAKTGRTSKAKIETTYRVFRETIVNRGEKLIDFQEVLNDLRDQPNKFFQLLPIRRPQRELELVGQKLEREVLDMQSVAGVGTDLLHPALYPSSTYDCVWSCPFLEICAVANWGGDVSHMIDSTMVSQTRTDLYASQIAESEDENGD